MGFILGFLFRALTDKVIEKLGLKFVTENKTLLRINKAIRSGGLSEIHPLSRKFIEKLTPEQLKKLQGQVNSALRHTQIKKAVIKQVQKHYQDNNVDVPGFTDKVLETLSKDELDKIDLCDRSLSSSWLSAGCFFPTFKQNEKWVGNLALTVKTGKHKTYTYFNVPLETWEAMKDSNGAGSVFWSRYLRGYVVGRSPSSVKTLTSKAQTFKRDNYKRPTTYLKHSSIKRNKSKILLKGAKPPQRKK